MYTYPAPKGMEEKNDRSARAGSKWRTGDHGSQGWTERPEAGSGSIRPYGGAQVVTECSVIKWVFKRRSRGNGDTSMGRGIAGELMKLE